MKITPANQISNKLILGLPCVLLFLVLVFSNKKELKVEQNDFNPYLESLPDNFFSALQNSQVNDSTYFYSVVDKVALRELIIFKAFPTDAELDTDFNIKLYINQKDSLAAAKPVNLRITNKAAKFNYNQTTVGVFRIPLPFIEVQKLEIKKKKISKTDIVWESTVNTPFKLLNYQPQALTPEDQNRATAAPNTYLQTFSKALNFYGITTVPYSYNLKKEALICSSPIFERFTSDLELTTAQTPSEHKFYKQLDKKDKALSKEIIFNGKHSKQATKLLEAYLNGEKDLESVFNISKIATFNALKNVFTKGCDETVYLVFNAENNLIEPVFVGSKCLGEVSKTVSEPIIKNINYQNEYVNALRLFSGLDFYDIFIKNDELFQKELVLINRYDSQNIFDYDIIKINQRVINKSLDQSTLILAELISFTNQTMVLSVRNTSIFPINILGLNYKVNKEILKLQTVKQILSNNKDTVRMEVPRSFENLFVDKKNKLAGFRLAKDIYDLNVSFSISGLNEEQFSDISPYQQNEKDLNDLFRSKTVINNHKNIVVDEKNKIITFSKDSVNISAPLIISKGYVFKLKQGTTVNIVNGGKIISYSPLSFIGTKQSPIKIVSSDKKGQGILILAEGENSFLRFVDFNYLTNPMHGSWNITGAVTFYESPVNLESVSINNNSCEDALNIVRTSFKMNNSSISNTQSDAFDGDFVVGEISNSFFNGLGNDAIDVSGSDLVVTNVIISNAGDKGISAGENSKMSLNQVKISSSEIAIAGKDLSVIDAINIEIFNTKLGFTAFQKKPEYGPSKIMVKGITMTNTQTKYLIESASSLFVDSKKIEATQNVKERMYGVEFGVSSSETKKAPRE
tara:strand:- start:3896 stop:6463 length:2568 start_codon:yes stop_codon:yes gene_type:complete